MQVTRITVEEVGERLNRGESSHLSICENPQAWAQSDQKPPGAIRVPARMIEKALAACVSQIGNQK